MAATHLNVSLRCIKYLLCAVNALFVLTGILIIAVGTTVYAEPFTNFHYFLDSSYLSPATLLIVSGCFIFIIAFFGCYGAFRESTCMVLSFAVMLGAVLLLEFAVALTAYLLHDRIHTYVETKINGTMYEYMSSIDAQEAMDHLQRTLQCCGLHHSYDWNSVASAQNHIRNPYFESCCAIMTSAKSPICLSHYASGCMDRLMMLVVHRITSLVTSAAAIALIQFTGIMLACTLGKAIRQHKTERERRRWEFREKIVNDYQPLGKTEPLSNGPAIYPVINPVMLSNALGRNINRS